MKKNDNVVTIRQKDIISDGEIESLFFGLLKLIKNNAEKQADISLKNKYVLTSTTLLEVLKQNKKLKSEIKILKSKLKSV